MISENNKNLIVNLLEQLMRTNWTEPIQRLADKAKPTMCRHTQDVADRIANYSIYASTESNIDVDFIPSYPSGNEKLRIYLMDAATHDKPLKIAHYFPTGKDHLDRDCVRACYFSVKLDSVTGNVVVESMGVKDIVSVANNRQMKVTTIRELVDKYADADPEVVVAVKTWLEDIAPRVLERYDLAVDRYIENFGFAVADAKYTECEKEAYILNAFGLNNKE